MKSIILLSVAIALVALTQGAVIDSSTYDFGKTVKLSDEVTVAYSVNDALQKIGFTITAKTTGWVGFGISNAPNMIKADLVIAGVQNDASKTEYFEDYHGDTSNGLPIKDTTRNWELLGPVREDATTTTFTVMRDLDTKDAAEDIVIKKEEINVVWAIGADDDVAKMHSKQGSLKINLLEPPTDPSTTVDPSAPTEDPSASTEDPNTTTEAPGSESTTPADDKKSSTEPEVPSTTDGASALSTVSFTLAVAALLVKLF